MADNSVVTQQKLQEFYDKKIYDYLNGATHTGCVPLGTILPYFGETAPTHFLICDGTEYAKADYPELAEHLLALTDPTPYAGSDANHFKVPDLRGEFLRGSGTNGHANQGSGGDVGVHQDGTLLSSFETNQNTGSFVLASDDETYGGLITFPDSVIRDATRRISFTNGIISTMPAGFKGTSRPTNTSVTYIIAYRNAYIDLALDSFPLGISNPTDGQLLMYDATAGRWVNGGHKYSTDEHVVGTWIDGKLVYERTFVLNNINSDSTSILNDSNVKVIEDKWVGKTAEGATYTSNSYTGTGEVQVCCFIATNSAGNILFFRRGSLYITSARITLRYTKTTD